MDPYNSNMQESNQGIHDVFDLYLQDWWLEAVSTSGSQIGLVKIEEAGKVVAAMPWCRKRNRVGLNRIYMPPFTQHVGPWFKPFENEFKQSTASSKLIRWTDMLLDGLPNYDMISINSLTQDNLWLPYYWRGYSQSTKYTYRLSLKDPEKVLWLGLDESIRRQIRKARKKGLTVEVSECWKGLYEMCELTFARQNMRFPYSRDQVARLCKACLDKGSGRIYKIRNKEKQIVSACLVASDKRITYYLLGGSDPQYRDLGSSSLCLWEAIREACGRSEIFDFEGSMSKSIAKFFSSFGASACPYNNLFHIRSKRVKLMKRARDFQSGLLVLTGIAQEHQ